MAAWRRSGAIEKHAGKLISRMQAKGIAPEFAERVFKQIRGFGEYGFPESHAASFALVAYLTAWLKHHYHDAFTAALLNAWPMGFYAPATIVDDARRHGVVVLPIDVARSAWLCTLEPASRGTGRWRFAVRMGLRYVKGLAEGNGEAIVAARAARPFRSVDDLVMRVPALAQGRPAAAGRERRLERARPTGRGLGTRSPAPRAPVGGAGRGAAARSRHTAAAARSRRGAALRAARSVRSHRLGLRGRRAQHARPSAGAVAPPAHRVRAARRQRGDRHAQRQRGFLRRAGDLPAAARHRGRGWCS